MTGKITAKSGLKSTNSDWTTTLSTTSTLRLTAKQTAYTPPKPQPKPQMSLFELMDNKANEEKPSENTQDVSQKTVQPDNPNRNDEEPCDDAETDEEPTEEELQEAAETEEEHPEPAMHEKAKAVQMQDSPFYQRYMRIQDKYPHCIVLFSRGDFYEALGKGAQILSENLALTLRARAYGRRSAPCR